ncbi:MAG: winged helix-turn-helix domain-containing protein [Bacteroidaceae bacterium]|nr:winged helix-turn-helix domain-containing protein [Bacteroidaceae bacterium]MBQ8008203.1 winged helix-turn-helix domain-containing protein [Bacteroidaceae bacterium]MBR1542273.1 winged helix-turn-helix domain-containing protein [Bacteroidaceae bacterium]
MNADKIAKNARLVWNILKGAASRMTFIDMIVKSQLHATDLAYAIGWLAREDRISMVEENGKQYFAAY